MHRTKKVILIKFIGVSLIALLFACNSEQEQVEKNKAPQYGAFKFTEKTYDFGKIKNGDTVSHVFTFSNIKTLAEFDEAVGSTPLAGLSAADIEDFRSSLVVRENVGI